MKEQAEVLAKKPYEAPRAEVLMIESQGVLCVSAIEGDLSTEAVTTGYFAFP